ncbi:sugar transferase [Gordonia phthalatica]|uniref:Bacterial sugar transferase domain-containing protein n=1 Tax=Gordonia phthalatica TaxID=1136941 RepID=A0A0N9NDQ9_9ACTN|nr:sugar transferase [Gordonia phthalatica]ALG85853.1 hypothetical protein ACH46_16885 [Gordonia phthalatica]
MAEAAARRRSWIDWYARGVRIGDVTVLVAVIVVMMTVHLGPAALVEGWNVDFWYSPKVGVALGVVWVICLHSAQSYDRRELGVGHDEYTAVLKASVSAFGVVAAATLVFGANPPRLLIGEVLVAGTAALVLGRWLWRQYVVRVRDSGRWLHRVLLVSDAASARGIVARSFRTPEAGYEIVAVCVPTAAASASTLDVGGRSVPIVEDLSRIGAHIDRFDVDVVGVMNTSDLGIKSVRELSWMVEDRNVDLLVAPSAIDVGVPRVVVRPLAGMSVLQVDSPQYRGANRVLKATFDRLGALVLILVCSPVMLVSAIAIKCSSRGPVFYRAERVGAANRGFTMWKFRTMIDGADAMRPSLQSVNDGNEVLFKMHDDPRVTKVGRFLRRYSLDELPQLFNVVGGSMSLVGPRPPLREEVDRYDAVVTRRLLVRPGMTGLWQVSGRSDLDWQRSVQLDLSYVENWSLAMDGVILLRTLRAVIAPTGAY